MLNYQLFITIIMYVFTVQIDKSLRVLIEVWRETDNLGTSITLFSHFNCILNYFYCINIRIIIMSNIDYEFPFNRHIYYIEIINFVH